MRFSSTGLSLAICLLIAPLFAGNPLPVAQTVAPLIHNPKFTRITADEGRLPADVRAIAQDNDGFIWFGTTSNGIQRYDGYELRPYLHDANNPHSLGYNYIAVLYVDKEGTLWVGTSGGGLERFNKKSDSFEHFLNEPGNSESLPSSYILSCMEDSKGRFWVGTRAGLSLLDRKTGRSRTFKQSATESMVNINCIRCMVEDPKTGILWLGTSDALCAFDPESGNFQNYRARCDNNSGAALNALSSILLDENGDLWCVAEAGGLRRCKLDLRSIPNPSNAPLYPEFEFFRHDQNDPQSLSCDILYRGLLDSKGRLWVATQKGLNVLDRRTMKFTRMFRIPGDPDSLNDNTILSVFEDHRGTIWVSSAFGGVNRLRSEDKNFVIYRNQFDNPNSVGQDIITSLCITRDGKLWVGNSEGVCSFDGAKWTRYRHEPSNPKSLESDYVYSLEEDTLGRLWIGTHDAGLCIFDGNTFIKPTLHSGNPAAAGKGDFYSGMRVNSLLADHNGGMWIGAKAYGLDHFDGKNFIHYAPLQSDGSRLPTEMASLGVIDGEGCLWYGTERQGLVCFDPKTGQFRRFLVDPANPGREINTGLYSLLDNHKGSLWIGSFNGLHRFDLKELRFEDRNSGGHNFPTVSVLSLLEDDSGILWLSTPSGIMRFDPKNGAARLYDKSDGLPSNQFSIRAAAKASDGRLYFDSVAGVVAFYPNQLKDNLCPPKVVITDFDLFDKAVVPGAQNSPIKDSIGTTKRIQLRHDQSVFSIKFAALDYEAPEKNRYAFKMEGFDEDWRIASAEQRIASYTNLPPGSYVFHVRGSNNDGVWSKEDARLAIIISPPWWNMLWFRVLVICTLVGGVFALFRRRVWEIQKRNVELTGQIEERRKIEATLRASEERFRALYDDNPAVYLTIDTQGLILSVNRFGADMLGRMAEELTGRSVFDIIKKEDVPLFQRHFELCLRQPGSAKRWEQRMLRRDGSELWVRPSALSLVRADGSRVVLLVCEDITEKVSLEGNLRQMQKIEALGQLASGVAHDFNNILTIILTQTAWAQSDDSTPQEKAEAMRDVLEAGRRASNLTRQLLVFSRRDTVQRSAVDLNDVITGISKMIRRLIGENILLKTELPSNPTPILADAGMIEQVLVNMSVNARDAMPGGGTLTIAVKEVSLNDGKMQGAGPATGDHYCIDISDTGLGIPPEVRARIFEPFFTTKPAGHGTGLGLATSLGIVQHHDGWIDVDSIPGAGTHFKIYLPRLIEKSAPTPDANKGIAHPLPGKIILLVEDDPVVRRSARLVLERYGHKVFEASDPKIALEIWSNHKNEIHLLMSDIVMPGDINGRNLALRLLAEKPDLKIGLMSGYSTGDMNGDGSVTPGLPVPLQKPISAEALLAYIAECLRD
jgi:PAS domain S-box-containing protein